MKDYIKAKETKPPPTLAFKKKAEEYKLNKLTILKQREVNEATYLKCPYFLIL